MVELLLKQLEGLMQGHNYQVTLKAHVFDSCSSIQDVFYAIKERYKDSDPKEGRLKKCGVKDFWKEIEYGFTYRGDEGSGMKINVSQERELSSLVDKFVEKLREFITNESKIYYYKDEQGLPGYPVFWGYSFIIFNSSEKKSILLIGSSSD